MSHGVCGRGREPLPGVGLAKLSRQCERWLSDTPLRTRSPGSEGSRSPVFNHAFCRKRKSRPGQGRSLSKWCVATEWKELDQPEHLCGHRVLSACWGSPRAACPPASGRRGWQPGKAHRKLLTRPAAGAVFLRVRSPAAPGTRLCPSDRGTVPDTHNVSSACGGQRGHASDRVWFTRGAAWRLPTSRVH